MDKHHDHHEGSGFFNGFLLGAIIGAAVVFFLFTDKGKKLLKTFMEEGFEGLEDFKGMLDEEVEQEGEENEEYEDLEEVEPSHLESVPHHSEHTHVEPIHHNHVDHDHPAHASHGPKRFFKRGKRV